MNKDTKFMAITFSPTFGYDFPAAEIRDTIKEAMKDAEKTIFCKEIWEINKSGLRINIYDINGELK